MVAVCTSWVVLFIKHGLEPSNSPVLGDGKGIAQILGNIVFNYAYITTLPSWVNESKSNVNIKKTIWASSGFSTFLFIVVGLLGSLAFGNMPSNSDILSVINSSPEANIFTKISVYAFPFAVLTASIPVFSIIVKYNLLQTKLPKFGAILLAIFLPWIIVIPFMTGDRLLYISNYASLFFSSASNFIIPLLIYLKSVQFRKNGRTMTDHQKQILKEAGIDPILLEQPMSPSSSVELEELQLIYRVFPRLDLEKCKRVAIACITLLGFIIPIVIITTFVFQYAT
ncbi:hypothetical protein PPL_10681 [Heterostelium album PN500]|uniref:Amino acid transporter transmembrane domain-containing protein n=1 Tax=Heterostelium pallidum (strain ATCC 26659 / Pp 5 / PN500) TaxID=670386 RepID=D3BRS0_HETP5|nr:hypothetical protein PPL_10681 [Heterostelium album PN500]EFA76102.1 hypothetical protein PPL_10681 [Heterostelium album PN500]|eukprot:XP_020428236.1 hypothetical protein PPL_10681 [Heterostelium album PN500]